MTCKSKLFLVTCKLQLFSIEMDAGIKIIKHRTINSTACFICIVILIGYYFSAMINQK